MQHTEEFKIESKTAENIEENKIIDGNNHELSDEQMQDVSGGNEYTTPEVNRLQPKRVY